MSQANFLIPTLVQRPGFYYRQLPKRIFVNFMLLMLGVFLLDHGGVAIEGMFASLGLACFKITPHLLAAAGMEINLLDSHAPSSVGLFSLFLLLTVRLLTPFYTLVFSHVWLYDNYSNKPPTSFMIVRWLTFAMVMAYLAVVIRAADFAPVGKNGYTVLGFVGLHLAGFYVAVAASLMALTIAYMYFQRRKAMVPAKAKTTKAGKQTAVTAAAEVVATAAPSPAAKHPPAPAAPTAEIEAFYKALAAELIQFIGFNGRAPGVEELVKTLTTLQRAAQMTSREAGLDEEEMTRRCQRALDLFHDAKLAPFKDVKAVQDLFNKQRPGLMLELATALQAQIVR